MVANRARPPRHLGFGGNGGRVGRGKVSPPGGLFALRSKTLLSADQRQGASLCRDPRRGGGGAGRKTGRCPANGGLRCPSHRLLVKLELRPSRQPAGESGNWKRSVKNMGFGRPCLFHRSRFPGPAQGKPSEGETREP